MRIAVLSVVICGLAAAAQAPNFSGKWAIETPGRAGAQQTILVFNQVGSEVEGTIARGGGGGGGSAAPAHREIVEGKVEGNTITFYVWAGSDRPVKTVYKGVMAAAGDQIDFVITGASGFPGGTPPGGGQAGRGPAGGRGQSGPQQVAAKRTR
jgi:hypothetical protein